MHFWGVSSQFLVAPLTMNGITSICLHHFQSRILKTFKYDCGLTLTLENSISLAMASDRADLQWLLLAEMRAVTHTSTSFDPCRWGWRLAVSLLLKDSMDFNGIKCAVHWGWGGFVMLQYRFVPILVPVSGPMLCICTSTCTSTNAPDASPATFLWAPSGRRAEQSSGK